MEKEELINKIKIFLDHRSIHRSHEFEVHLSKLINELELFKLNTSEDVFLGTVTALQSFILSSSTNSDYIVAKDAIFGEFKEIRNEGFYKRYLYNVKITATYIKAYQLTEDEYIGAFGKKRYSSYDSFRIVRNRMIKNE